MTEPQKKGEVASNPVRSEPPPSAAAVKGKQRCAVTIKPGSVRLVDGDLSFEGYVDGDERCIPIVIMSVEHNTPYFRRVRSKDKRVEAILGLLSCSACEKLESKLKGLSEITIELDE